MENTAHTKYTRIMFLILACVLFFASVAGYFVFQRTRSNQPGGISTSQSPVFNLPTSPRLRGASQSPTPTLIPYPVQGSFVLKEASGVQNIKLGSPFTLNLIATSSTDTVAGYDAILSYDVSAFERQSVQNKADAFRIFTYDRGTHLSISGTKNLSVAEPIRFTNTPIISFVFLAKKKGTYIFSLKAVGNESSKLVNESAQVSYPETPDLRLEIN